MKLVYQEAAVRWGEALPLGNGQIGAMVYGIKKCEKINLTENTFYSGETERGANQSGAGQAFQRMREADRKGEYDKVHEEAERFIGRRENYGSHLPTGNLYIEYSLDENLQEYERGLDIEKGKTWLLQSDKHVRITEEVRTSNPDKVMLVNIASDKKTSVKVWFEPYNQEGGFAAEQDRIRFWADAIETMHCDEKTGVRLEGAIKIKTDGMLVYQKNAVQVLECTYVDVYLAMETDFKNQDVEQETLYLEAEKRCLLAKNRGREDVIKRHEADMRILTEGTRLELEGTDAVSDKIPFLFQYGRYLLFCSSRKDSKLPAHLQGIWNDNVACRIGWTCDMHLDINTQMNYWPADCTGLGDCVHPLIHWMQDILIPEGRKTAEISYGLKGWVGEIVSNAWGYAAPYWASPIAPCPTGGVWILTHMWEHYLYTEDKEFLAETAFPMIEEAVLFFKEYVYKAESGLYTCGPSISPENSFLYKGEQRQISSGCTYEILMIRELFDIYMKAADILELRQGEEYCEVKEIHGRLLPYRILKNGCIAEWDHDFQEADPQHRHTSHLLGLFPFAQITPEETPELCAAAEKTIQRKITPKENWEDTGWARSMLMLYEARLQNGEKTYGHICNMVEKLSEPNHMIYHPPTRGAAAFDHVYELDGNTGLCTCVGEMLVQSHRDRIRLLPALPNEWKKGKISDFHVRGNMIVDVEWENGMLKKATLKSGTPKKVRLCLNEKNIIVKIDREIEITLDDFR